MAATVPPTPEAQLHDNGPRYMRLGEILIDLARESDALKAFERVLRFDPNHSEALRYHRLLLRGRH